MYQYRKGIITAEERIKILKEATSMGWKEESELCFYLLDSTKDFSLNPIELTLKLSSLQTKNINIDRFKRHLLDSQGLIEQYKKIYNKHIKISKEIINELLTNPKLLGKELSNLLEWFNHRINLTKKEVIKNTEDKLTVIDKDFYPFCPITNKEIIYSLLFDYLFRKNKIKHPIFNRYTEPLTFRIDDKKNLILLNEETNKPLSLIELTSLLEDIKNNPFTTGEMLYLIKAVANLSLTNTFFNYSNENLLIKILSSAKWNTFIQELPEDYKAFSLLDKTRTFHLELRKKLKEKIQKIIENTNLLSVEVVVKAEDNKNICIYNLDLMKTSIKYECQDLCWANYIINNPIVNDKSVSNTNIHSLLKTVDNLVTPLTEYQVKEYGNSSINILLKTSSQETMLSVNRK